MSNTLETPQTSHAREQVLVLQPRQHLLAAVLARLRALPAPT